jgi:broad specificity phosphatase PhoE
VSDVVRLTMVSHAMTEAMAAARFPADEPLNDLGRRQVKRLDHNGDSRQVAGPERRAGQTAQLSGLRAVTEPRLADLDCGRWRGCTLAELSQEDVEAWLSDPDRAPHGGESIVDLIQRVAGWLVSLTDNGSPVVAVTHPAVIRAAILHTLEAPPKSFWRIDIAPASRTVLYSRSGRWTLRL